MEKITYFTSESVTEGHPDKFCDYVSDSILDEHLKQDRDSRVACETAASGNMVVILGQITSTATLDYEEIVKKAFKEVGYDYTENLSIITKINKQSSDIAAGVDNGIDINNTKTKSLGAGDQGMMFGYACDETEELMPLAIVLAHKLSKKLSQVRKSGTLNYLKSDGKSQVTIKYKGDTPVHIDTVLLSSQHADEISLENLKKDLKKYVIDEILPKNLYDENTNILINPTGRFVTGGPEGDAGLTGRKIIVDTYGGYARHGGGAFSGKDPTKVDRSGAYMARYIAKNIIKAGLAKKCEIQLAYAIGVSEPVSVNIDTFNTASIDEQLLCSAVKTVFDLSPEGIINSLDLKQPIYKRLSAYGHMGRDDLSLSWEKTDRVEAILNALR